MAFKKYIEETSVFNEAYPVVNGIDWIANVQAMEADGLDASAREAIVAHYLPGYRKRSLRYGLVYGSAPGYLREQFERDDSICSAMSWVCAEGGLASDLDAVLTGLGVRFARVDSRDGLIDRVVFAKPSKGALLEEKLQALEANGGAEPVFIRARHFVGLPRLEQRFDEACRPDHLSGTGAAAALFSTFVEVEPNMTPVQRWEVWPACLQALCPSRVPMAYGVKVKPSADREDRAEVLAELAREVEAIKQAPLPKEATAELAR